MSLLPATTARAILGRPSPPEPRLRAKPSSGRLRPAAIRSTAAPPSSSAVPPIVRVHTDLSIPRTTNASLDIDTSIYTRKERRPSGLPTPVDRSTTPIARPRTGPPTKDHRVFSLGGSKAPPSTASSSASSDKKSTGEKRVRRVLKKGPSVNADKTYGLSARKGSIISGNASTTSLSTTSSFAGSQNTSQTSILGIAAPATSSQTSLLPTTRQRSGSSSSSAPRLNTQDLSLPGPSYIFTAGESSPSTRYTDSPFSHSSTPTSASSQSPGPAAMLRGFSSSPRRPPVTRKRTASVSSVDISEVGLEPVRESTTSSSSSSTIRALAQLSKDGDSSPRNPPMPENVKDYHRSPTSSTSKSPNLEPSPQFFQSPSKLSPSPVLSQLRRKPSTSGIPSRPTKEPTGLGLLIPTHQSATPTPTVVRTRSRSFGTSNPLQPKGRKESKDAAVNPPMPPRGPPAPQQQNVAKAGQVPTVHGHSYNTVPPSKKANDPVKDMGSSVSASPKPAIRPGFFARGRAKSEENAPEKPVRRGPAAGTGYEGYGAFGKASRGRSGSIGASGNPTRGRSGSQTSVRSRSGSRGSRNSASVEMDDYFLDKLKPVVIVGGEVVENHNRPVEMVRSGSSPAVMETQLSGGNLDVSRSGSSIGVISRGPSPSSGSENETVARRRAAHIGRAVTPIPAPIDTSISQRRHMPSPGPSLSESMSSRKGSVDDGVPPTSAKPKSKRWNFFQKSTPKATVAVASPPVPPPSAPATMGTIPAIQRSNTRRHVPAHYALLDQEEQQEAQELVDRMHELRHQHVASAESASYTQALRRQHTVHFADDVAEIGKSPSPLGAPFVDGEDARERVRQAKSAERKAIQQMPLRPAVATKPKLPQVRTRLSRLVHEQEKQGWSAPPQIGRSESDLFDSPSAGEEFQINWDSYGLTPTDATSGQEKSKNFLEYDPLDIRGRRTAAVERHTDNDDTPVLTARPDVAWPVQKQSVPSVQLTPVITQSPPEAVPSRTESKGKGKGRGNGKETVVEPEEEVWTEYDDLEGLYGFSQQQPAATTKPATGVKRSNTARSTTSSLGSPFQYADLCSPSQLKFESPEVPQHEEVSKDGYSLDSPTLPAILPIEPVPANIPVLSPEDSLLSPEHALQLPPAGQNVLTPATPAFSISSFIRYYGETDSQRGLSMLSTQLGDRGSREAVKTHRSTNSSGSNSSTSSGGSVATAAVEDEMKIRPWALIASRWLSFDRVLVSPVHASLQSEPGRVLVVDGLGTDDWSFYCALSYPSAKVYNLSQHPTIPSNDNMPPASPSVPRPTNHHQIHYPSFAASFPFPKSFFNAICFRFPPSTSQPNWGFILSECKRVLQPGGYLETSFLDAELMNAGPRARRAVDLVKAIMERESSSSNIRPASEKIIRILKKKGFEDMATCLLALPVAGKLKVVDQTTQDWGGDREPEVVGDVVGKVARWWYTRCYEGIITQGGEMMRRSMWGNRKLLEECRREETKARLLVACARKPLKGGGGGSPRR